MDALAERWAPRVLSILRIAVALIFIEHGTQKLFGFPAAPANGYPEFLSLLWWQGVIEVLGGGLLLLGIFTRLVAFILSGNMAVAYWMVHAPKKRRRHPLLLRLPLHCRRRGRLVERRPPPQALLSAF